MPTSQVRGVDSGVFTEADVCLGAMVLGHSLKDRGAKAPLVAFVLIEKLSSDTITELRVCSPPQMACTATNASRRSTMTLSLSSKSSTRARRTSMP